MDKCIVLFVLLLVPCSTMSQVYIINLTSEGTIDTITSPNYPDNYDNDADIYWRVIAPTGFRVMVKFTDFNLQGFFDTLSVYHGLTSSFEDATRRALLWGSSLPDNISSIGSYLWLRFKTDNSLTDEGFSLSVSAVEPVIIKLTSDETDMDIISPNYPTNYDNDVDIEWQVIAPRGFRVMVQFTDFNLEEGTRWKVGDSLSVYHGLTNSLEDASFRAFISGSSLRDNISSIGSYLWLWFTSDGSVTETGFSLSVSAVEPVIINLKSEETTMNITSPNYPNNYVNNVDVLWRVISPIGFRVMVQFNDFKLEPGDSLIIYHGLTNSLEDATQRALLSGSSLPDNISSIGSYLWLWFASDGSVSETGFSLSVRAVKPNWACDFKEDTCGLIINEGSWIIGEQANYYYIEAYTNMASFKIPHAFTSDEGSLSFGLYQESSDFGHISVTVCKSQDPSLFTIPFGLVEDLYGYIQYNCSGIQDIEVKFTKLDSQRTSIRVFDIQLYEISGPTTASPSTVGTQTTPLPGTLPESTQPMDKSTQGSGGSKSSLIPALSSTIVLILIIIVIITVFVFMRRRFRDPKVTEPVDQEDDHPNLYNNPVYCSKDDGLPVPDLIISTNSRSGSLSQARHPSTCMDNRYEECEGDRHPVTNADGYLSHHDAHSDTHSLPQKDLQNGGKQGQLDGPAVLDDDEEYNALTFNQSSDITRAMKKPTSGGEGVDNGYGVLDLAEQKDSKLFVNSPQLHNDDVYNTLNGGPQEQQNGKQNATDLSSGYQDLKLGQSNIPISHQGLNHKMGSTDDGSTGGYQSLSPGTKGPGPKAGSYERNQPGDESEYHSYQDPTEMNQDGSARTPAELDVFTSDKYNVLNSGKEVGDYHVYQATDDADVEEGNYEDLDAKMSREDEYSEIGQNQNHAPGTTDKAPFEPIYSDEVYSEFQGN